MSDTLIQSFFSLFTYFGQFFMLDNVLSSFVGLFIVIGLIGLIFTRFWGFGK